MADISNKKVAILATNGFEQSELEKPLEALRGAGAEVHVVSPDGEDIKGWEGSDWGRTVKADKALSDVKADDYNALVLPGGQINPDLLRVNDEALNFIKTFWDQKKPIGAICHAPWLLVETGIAKGRDLTSYKSIKTDLVNAGANWQDSEVVVDQALVTSRNPDDLPAFCDKLIEEIAEGKHESRAA
ncbi:type 1 glutamine amidotransferase [Roseovarius sp. SCSIO 43702]|uniref:type 1 glutamine amidotransferase domain-containing protein n=1 Tax=Roseovarius sp. SCSIO 43702 TaxID=2823043 RepID=UPI001C735C78|nr:type 1 glutamine amidotransferase domain-containing protein [Roseovarius sp. SCSIO 43702]QYX56926.1 type 1 glutamine amidotransferase [Roseovarius sp. SCSIO 43702]